MGVRSTDMTHKFDKTMILTILLMIGLSVTSSIIAPSDNFEFTLSNYIIGYCLTILGIIFVVYLIRHISGNKLRSKKHAEHPRFFSVWSYFWRATLTYALAYFSAVSITIIFDFRIEIPSVSATIVASFLTYFMSVFYVWLLFSKNRRGQFNWLIQTIR